MGETPEVLSLVFLNIMDGDENIKGFQSLKEADILLSVFHSRFSFLRNIYKLQESIAHHMLNKK